jgi:hypothetical protein
MSDHQQSRTIRLVAAGASDRGSFLPPASFAPVQATPQHPPFHGHRPILPRSLHLPVASTDGSFTKNFNKTGVQLWTDHQSAAVATFGAAAQLLGLISELSPGAVTTGAARSNASCDAIERYFSPFILELIRPAVATR